VKNAENALLIAARFDGGRLTAIQTVTVNGSRNAVLTMRGSGTQYRLLLVDRTTFVPLCGAWES